MKIGIIVHSQTGNTYSVTEQLRDKLTLEGHMVEIEKLVSIGDEQTDVNKIRFEKIPDITKYDALVFGGPVRGASISPVLSAFLAKCDSLKGKKTVCIVTQFFPFEWMGGTRAIGQIKEACEAKGAAVLGTEIINWTNVLRKKKISDAVEHLSKLIRQ